MTPFMLAVAALLDRQPDEQADAGPALAMSSSYTLPIPAAIDTHLNLRAHAEQLVSEANAVLRHRGEVIVLEDSCGPGVLAFTLAYRDQAIWVGTEIAGDRARLVTAGTEVPAGQPPDRQPLHVATAEQLQALLLRLLDEQRRDGITHP